MQALVETRDEHEIDRALAAGFVINAPRPAVLRIAPPLVVEEGQLDSFVARLPAFLEGAA